MIISNTSPIYYLQQLGRLDILRDLFGRVVTTPQVRDELDAGQAQGLDVPDINALEWIDVRSVSVPPFLDLIGDLGKGESSILALAVEHPGSRLIVDDHLARDVAEDQEIKVTGTLGVLLLAKERGLIERIDGVMRQLLQHGFRCSRTLQTEILRLAEEVGSADDQ